MPTDLVRKCETGRYGLDEREQEDARMRVIRSWTIQGFFIGAARSALALYVMNGPLLTDCQEGQSSRRECCCVTPQHQNGPREDFVLSSTE